MELNQLKRDYPYNLTEIDRRCVLSELKHEDASSVLYRHLEYIDCTKTISNGMRIIQTINRNYNFELHRLFCLLDTIKEENEDLYNEVSNRILEIHNNNLEFEKVVPPIIYDKKTYTNNKKRKRKAKEGSLFPEEGTKKKRISKEERKQMKIQDKIKSLGFGTFKLINKV